MFTHTLIRIYCMKTEWWNEATSEDAVTVYFSILLFRLFPVIYFKNSDVMVCTVTLWCESFPGLVSGHGFAAQGHYIFLFLNLNKLFSKMFAAIHTPKPAVGKDSLFNTSSLMFITIRPFHLASLNDMGISCVLVCASLIIGKVEHLFMFFLFVCFLVLRIEPVDA